MKEVQDIATGNVELEDIFKDETVMTDSTNEKYLGDVFSSNGSNAKNIEARQTKGKGIVSQIMSILEDVCFGHFQFEVAAILRISLIINGILTNAEAWYDIKKTELETLEKIDESLLRQILEAPCSTPKEMLYLEMGLLPIRFIIMSRRMNFLHSILNEKQESLIYRFFRAQVDNPVKNDWAETVLQDLEVLGLPKFEEIQQMKQTVFQNLVKSSIAKEAFKYLLKKKNGDTETRGHSKVAHIEYKRLEMQNFLRPNGVSIQDAKFIFLVRTRMLDIKANFQNSHANMLCIACKEEDETQEHLLQCKVLSDENTVVEELPEYGNLFGENLEKQITVAQILNTNFKKRKSFK